MSQHTTLMNQVHDWVLEAGERIKDTLSSPIMVEEKTDRRDLVTNVDKETEAFLVAKIKTHYPEDQIIGEEGLGTNPTSTKGRIWVIDPIDGTMNFVTQQENFCVMIGIFEEDVPVLGFIYNVIKGEFIYGGKAVGVFLNEKELPMVDNTPLESGIIGVNGWMFANNIDHTQEIAFSGLGVRMFGCAGLDFLDVLRGKQVAYISNLAPWDFAAGVALSEPLGLVCRNLDGSTYDILGGRTKFIVATEQAFNTIYKKFIK